MWTKKNAAFALVVTVVLILVSHRTSANMIEEVSKSPDGKCLRESDKMTLGVGESKTLPGCVELYCRTFAEKYYIQHANCPAIDDKPGCTKVEGAKDKIFPDCCATQKCP